jgi:hypothetical protein
LGGGGFVVVVIAAAAGFVLIVFGDGVAAMFSRRTSFGKRILTAQQRQKSHSFVVLIRHLRQRRPLLLLLSHLSFFLGRGDRRRGYLR